jgi:sigma-B regulation protein RsbU (phosphoserine phosphatase)
MDDVILAYTDGVSEAMTARDEEWGEERMIAAFQSAHVAGADEIVNEVLRAADGFTCGAPQHDDMTVLVMKISANHP